MKRNFLIIAIVVLMKSICSGQYLSSDSLMETSAVVYDPSGQYSEPFKNTLKDELAGVRILALGEASHEDGSTFEQKAGLVEFLHQEMGFEVIAFEYGFYGNWKTNRKLKAGMNVEEAVKYSGWSKSEYAFPVYEYIAQSYETSKPLQYAGFDKEKVPDGIPNMTAFFDTLISDLEFKISLSERSVLDSLIAAIYGGMGNEIKSRITFDQRNRAKEIIEELHNELLINRNQLISKFGEKELMIRDYVLQSLLMSEKAVFAGSFHNIVRDKNMADRIIFLADSMYKGKKLILWGASGHFARNMIAIDRKLPEGSYGFFPYYQTGDWLFEHFGKAYYSLAFIAAEGETGTIYPEGHRFKKYEVLRPLENNHPNSYEITARETGAEFLFTSLRAIPESSSFNRPFVAYPLGYMEDRANWSKIFDAFFFIRTMKADEWR